MRNPLPSAPFIVALLAAFALIPAPALTQDAMPPEEYRELARDLLRELIEINTTQSTGNTTEAAEAMAEHLRAAGFSEENLFVGGPAPNRGNLVARLPGSDPSAEPILLLAHIDVVEADPADWTVDPFTFTEQDGWFYGRGVTDDKDEAAIHIANLIRMKREGFTPEGDIIVALTADEEGGDYNGVQWLIENHRELIDAELALNEGGGGSIKNDQRISNNVQLSEKKYQSFTFEATNPGGHSSLPIRDNAIYELSEALLAVREHAFPIMLDEVTRAYFEGTADLVDAEMGGAIRRVLENPADEEALAMVATEPGFNARLRTTCVATMADAGHAPNALPQRASATVNCRILPAQDPEDVLRTLQQLAGDEVSVTPQAPARPSPPSPLRPDVLGDIQVVTAELWPDVPVLPVMSTGATDGLYLRNAGIPVYGVSGLFQDVDDVRAHGQDERIRAENFYQGMEFLYRLTKRLAGE